jgi:DNA-directed RNA polymerase specialized sigma24 family protein
LSARVPSELHLSSTSLLLEALTQREDEAVWREFDQRFRGIVFGLARRAGLSAEDAADAAQQTLVDAVAGLRAGTFDRARGRLRCWILAIARNRIADAFRLRRKRREERGDSALGDVPSEQVLADWWELERRRVIFERALAELRATSHISPRNLSVFEHLLRNPADPGGVARDFGIEPADVYLIKHRVAACLRKIISRLSELFDDGVAAHPAEYGLPE